MNRKIIFLVILIAGLLASSYVAGQRARVETRNKAVQLVVDYDEIAAMSAATGRSETDLLKIFRDAGATAVAITEPTIQDLIDQGKIRTGFGSSLSLDPSIKTQVWNRLSKLLEGGSWRVVPSPTGDLAVHLADLHYLETVPMGLPDEAVANVREAGMEVVGRLVNYSGASANAINTILSEVKAQGVKKVIFQGDQVLGFRGGVEDTAKAFERTGMLFGRVEFAKQKGEIGLAAKIPGQVLVVHSIAQNEMPMLDAGSIAERFQRGVRERGVRLCYVRMFATASDNLVAANAEYISRIARAINSAGYVIAPAHSFDEVTVPRWIRAIAGAGVGAGIILLVLSVVDLTAAAAIVWGIVALAVCAGLPMIGDVGAKVVAFASALTFPTLGALMAVGSVPEAPAITPRPLIRAIGRLIAAIAIAVAGGLLITGLLSERVFMLRIEQFIGIKAAHVIPLAVLAILFAGGIAWRSGTWRDQKEKLIDRFSDIIGNPVLIWEAAGMLVVLVVVVMMVARSGNDPGVGVSETELKVRALLDKIMLVRPRTKEFLLGYPLLLAGIAFALRGRRTWAAPLVVVGAIGLVSALNTFCHIHTPLFISVLRVINGAIVGSLIGIVLYHFVKDLPGRERK